MPFPPLENDLAATAPITRSQNGEFLWELGVRDAFVRTFDLGPGLVAAAAFVPDDPDNLAVFEILRQGDGPATERFTAGGGVFHSRFLNLSVTDAAPIAITALRDDAGPGGAAFPFTTPRIVINIDDEVPSPSLNQIAPRIAVGEAFASAINGWGDQDGIRIVNVARGFAHEVSVTVGDGDFIDGIEVLIESVNIGAPNEFASIDVGSDETLHVGAGDTEYLVRLAPRGADLTRLPGNVDYEVVFERVDVVADVALTGTVGALTGLQIHAGTTRAIALETAEDRDTLSFMAEPGVTYVIDVEGATAAIDDDAGVSVTTGDEATQVFRAASVGPISFSVDEADVVHVIVESLGKTDVLGAFAVHLDSDQRNFVSFDPGETIRGNGRGNRITGDDGANELFGFGGRDRLDGDFGGDRLFGGQGDDRLFGGSGRDRLLGQGGRDRLDGGEGRDRLEGGGGNDRLDGGGGADLLTGGRGRDVFVQSGGRDRVLDWRNGQDVFEIDAGAARFAQLRLRQRGDDVLIDTRAGDFRVEDARVRQFDAGDFEFV